LEETYKLEITAGVNTNINRAIISGEDKGTFVLPKGTCFLPIFSTHLERIFYRAIRES
jgi:hypothetical protein